MKRDEVELTGGQWLVTLVVALGLVHAACGKTKSDEHADGGPDITSSGKGGIGGADAGGGGSAGSAGNGDAGERGGGGAVSAPGGGGGGGAMASGGILGSGGVGGTGSGGASNLGKTYGCTVPVPLGSGGGAEPAGTGGQGGASEPATCVVGQTYCFRKRGFSPNSAECAQLPAPCATIPTCACIAAGTSPNCTCSDFNGEVEVTCDQI
ncbi:MAG TPA: hypothetical protein VGP07_21815 [Polyangia bacterium]